MIHNHMHKLTQHTHFGVEKVLVTFGTQNYRNRGFHWPLGPSD